MRPQVRSFTIVLVVLSCILEFNACKEVQNVTGPPERTSLTDPSAAPVILFTMPGAGAVGPFPVYSTIQSSLPHFVVQFSKLMDVNSMNRSNVRIEGFPQGAFVYPRSSYYRNFSDVVEFTVYDSARGYSIPYQLGDTYTVRFLSSVRDINGNGVGASSSFSFVPEPVFRIVGVYPPTDDSPLTPTYYTFPTIYFNSPIDAGIFTYLQVSPSLPGTWQINWDSLSVALRLSSDLAFSTTYVVQVLAGAEDHGHHALAREYVAIYTTRPFEVDHVYPERGSTDFYPSDNLYLGLTGPIDTASVAGAVSIDPPVSFHTGSAGNSMYVYPQHRWGTSTHYVVTIGTSLKAKDGTYLATPFTTDFTTQPFMVSWISPGDGSTNVSPSTSIFVYCNDDVDATTVPSAFGISPPVSGDFGISGSSFSFIPSSPLAANTTYTVAISALLTSTSGKPIPRAMVIRFTTSQ